MKNLFEYAIPTHGEWFKTLLQNDDVTIEVIVSSDTPDQKVYNQAHDEAVLLIDGEATLELQDQEITMKPGDFLHIPAHTPHRVLKTAKGSRWLAIHTKAPLC